MRHLPARDRKIVADIGVAVAFVGIVSNVHSLCATYSWLAWLCTLPKVVVGIISGILPPALLAILMMLLPIVLRLLARFEGMPQRTSIELSLMTRYFIFQVMVSAVPDLVQRRLLNWGPAFLLDCDPFVGYYRSAAAACQQPGFYPLLARSEPP